MALSPSQFPAKPPIKAVEATLAQLAEGLGLISGGYITTSRSLCESGLRTKPWEVLAQDREISLLVPVATEKI